MCTSLCTIRVHNTTQNSSDKSRLILKTTAIAHICCLWRGGRINTLKMYRSEIFTDHLNTNLLLISASKRNWKISQHLAKSTAKVEVSSFLDKAILTVN